jgi:hypothetical protein
MRVSYLHIRDSYWCPLSSADDLAAHRCFASVDSFPPLLLEVSLTPQTSVEGRMVLYARAVTLFPIKSYE